MFAAKQAIDMSTPCDRWLTTMDAAGNLHCDRLRVLLRTKLARNSFHSLTTQTASQYQSHIASSIRQAKKDAENALASVSPSHPNGISFLDRTASELKNVYQTFTLCSPSSHAQMQFWILTNGKTRALSHTSRPHLLQQVEERLHSVPVTSF